MDEVEELSKFLVKWAKKHDYSFVLPTGHDDKPIDNFFINVKTKTIYVSELGIDEPLTEVG